jgi:hypothetical protein
MVAFGEDPVAVPDWAGACEQSKVKEVRPQNPQPASMARLPTES